MNIILMGIQGSGKSTQGNLLAKELGIPYLSSGHIFREMAKEDTQWGRYVKKTMDLGHLIPDREAVPIVMEYLQKDEYKQGWIMDGFPRTPVQARALNIPIQDVLYINVSDEETLKRLHDRKENRSDDTDDAIQKRIEIFHTLTQPVLDYYKKSGFLREINGEQSIDDVHRDIMKSLSH